MAETQDAALSEQEAAEIIERVMVYAYDIDLRLDPKAKAAAGRRLIELLASRTPPAGMVVVLSRDRNGDALLFDQRPRWAEPPGLWVCSALTDTVIGQMSSGSAEALGVMPGECRAFRLVPHD